MVMWKMDDINYPNLKHTARQLSNMQMNENNWTTPESRENRPKKGHRSYASKNPHSYQVEDQQPTVGAESEKDSFNNIWDTMQKAQTSITPHNTGERGESSTRDLTCHFCNKRGHIAPKCWEKNPHLKPEWMRNPNGQPLTDIHPTRYTTSNVKEPEKRTICDHCKKPGHTITKCWIKKNSETPFGERECFRCKQKGHIARYCPTEATRQSAPIPPPQSMASTGPKSN
jgi:hypothetical protein